MPLWNRGYYIYSYYTDEGYYRVHSILRSKVGCDVILRFKFEDSNRKVIGERGFFTIQILSEKAYLL